jgi:hypothetical protein
VAEGFDQADIARLCHDIFEVDRRGQIVFAWLEARFTGAAVTEGGIDAVLKTYKAIGLMVERGRRPPPPPEEDDA